MKKEVDFIAAHMEEVRKMEEAAEKKPPTKREWQRFQLTREQASVEESQLKKVKNEKRWNQVENVFYPCLCEIAEVQGGRVELDIDEEMLFLAFLYRG